MARFQYQRLAAPLSTAPRGETPDKWGQPQSVPTRAWANLQRQRALACVAPFLAFTLYTTAPVVPPSLDKWSPATAANPPVARQNRVAQAGYFFAPGLQPVPRLDSWQRQSPELIRRQIRRDQWPSFAFVGKPEVPFDGWSSSQSALPTRLGIRRSLWSESVLSPFVRSITVDQWIGNYPTPRAGPLRMPAGPCCVGPERIIAPNPDSWMPSPALPQRRLTTAHLSVFFDIDRQPRVELDRWFVRSEFPIAKPPSLVRGPTLFAPPVIPAPLLSAWWFNSPEPVRARFKAAAYFPAGLLVLDLPEPVLAYVLSALRLRAAPHNVPLDLALLTDKIGVMKRASALQVIPRFSRVAGTPRAAAIAALTESPTLSPVSRSGQLSTTDRSAALSLRQNISSAVPGNRTLRVTINRRTYNAND